MGVGAGVVGTGDGAGVGDFVGAGVGGSVGNDDGERWCVVKDISCQGTSSLDEARREAAVTAQAAASGARVPQMFGLETGVVHGTVHAYLVMQLVPGQPLGKWLDARKGHVQSVQEGVALATRIVGEVGSALGCIG